MSNKIVVVGSYNVDMTIKTTRVPKSGETVFGESVTFGHGGKGANQAVAAVRAGADVCLIAKVGADSYGKKAIANLRNEGINVECIMVDAVTPTGMATIIVNEQGENYIVVVSGANSTLSRDDIEEMREVILSADILLLQLESPIKTVKSAIKLAYENGVKVILNPAPAQLLEPEFLKQISIITPNKVEAEMLTGIKIVDESTLAEAGSKLLAHGIEISLITLGAKGVYLSQDSRNQLIQANKVNVVDTTGAGDVFNGMLAAHLQNMPVFNEAVSFATAAATLSVTKLGTQVAIPTLEDINNFLTGVKSLEDIIKK